MSAMTKKEWMEYLEKTWDAAQKEAWSNNSEWQQDRAKQVLAQMRGVEL